MECAPARYAQQLVEGLEVNARCPLADISLALGAIAGALSETMAAKNLNEARVEDAQRQNPAETAALLADQAFAPVEP